MGWGGGGCSFCKQCVFAPVLPLCLRFRHAKPKLVIDRLSFFSVVDDPLRCFCPGPFFAHNVNPRNAQMNVQVCRKTPMSEEARQGALARVARSPKAEAFTGADLQAVVDTAQLAAIHSYLEVTI